MPRSRWRRTYLQQHADGGDGAGRVVERQQEQAHLLHRRLPQLLQRGDGRGVEQPTVARKRAGGRGGQQQGAQRPGGGAQGHLQQAAEAARGEQLPGAGRQVL